MFVCILGSDATFKVENNILSTKWHQAETEHCMASSSFQVLIVSFESQIWHFMHVTVRRSSQVGIKRREAHDQVDRCHFMRVI